MAEWHPMARWMKTPVILGHEFAGVVSDIGANVSELRSADAIAVESVIWCGRCPAGHAGKTNVCVERRLFGIHEPGGLAEAIRTPRQRENTGDAHFSAFSMARFTT
jgi:threonine dehydrogenase-like Zn-dependent dehydrogenase